MRGAEADLDTAQCRRQAGDAVSKAQGRVAGRLHVTPAMSRILSERIRAQLVLECECLQMTRSFKPRGALNKIDQLDAA